MSLTIIDRGSDNQVSNESPEIDVKLTFRGDRNHVKIHAGCNCAGTNIDIGSGCYIEIHNKCSLICLDIYCENDARIIIGEGSVFNYFCQLRCHEPSSIVVGKGFLCGAGALITTSDMHSIFDIATGERINPAKDVAIGDSVWVGQNVYVLKGAIIGSGSVIGAKALVSHEIPSNVIAAGVPAKVIRTGICWSHELTGASLSINKDAR